MIHRPFHYFLCVVSLDVSKNTLKEKCETEGLPGMWGVIVQFSSVQFSRSVVSDSLQLHESQHAGPPCPSPTPGVHSDSHPPSQ